MSVSLRQSPGFLPEGFALRRTLVGSDEPGFGRTPGQTILIYTRGWDEGDWVTPLTVYLAPGGPESLVGTENREGANEDLQIRGVSGQYHDGLWSAASDRSGTVVWSTDFAHSLTVRSSAVRVGVRGNKQQLSRHQLRQIAESFDYGAGETT